MPHIEDDNAQLDRRLRAIEAHLGLRATGIDTNGDAHLSADTPPLEVMEIQRDEARKERDEAIRQRDSARSAVEAQRKVAAARMHELDEARREIARLQGELAEACELPRSERDTDPEIDVRASGETRKCGE